MQTPSSLATTINAMNIRLYALDDYERYEYTIVRS
jgi:hypothetical protein